MPDFSLSDSRCMTPQINNALFAPFALQHALKSPLHQALLPPPSEGLFGLGDQKFENQFFRFLMNGLNLGFNICIRERERRFFFLFWSFMMIVQSGAVLARGTL